MFNDSSLRTQRHYDTGAPLQNEQVAMAVTDQERSHTIAMPLRLLPAPARMGGQTGLQWGVAGACGALLGAIPLVLMPGLPDRLVPVGVMALVFPFIMMIVGHVRHILLAIVILDTPLQVGSFNLNYDQGAGDLGAYAGLNISLTLGSLILLYALWLFDLLGRVGPRPRPILRPGLPLAMYIGFTALSFFGTTDLSLSLDELILLVQTFFLYIYIVSAVRDRQDVLFVISICLIGLALESLIMIALSATGHTLALPGLKTNIDPGSVGDGSRVGGTIGSGNGAAEYLGLLLAPGFSLLLTPFGKRHKWFLVVALGLGTLALILTLSRGGWTGFAVSMAILGLLAWRRGLLSLSKPLIFVGMFAVISLLAGNPIIDRLTGNDNGAAAGRLPLITIASRIIQSHPLLGVGLNNFAVVMHSYITPDLGHIWIYIVHNKYLLIWAETGLGGLLAFILFLLLALLHGWKCWKLHDPVLAPLALGLGAAVVGDMVHMMVDVFNSRTATQQLWLIAALLVAMHRISAADTARHGAGTVSAAPRAPRISASRARVPSQAPLRSARRMRS
jgi:putative inorganic carbon (hco3(-)) transporter